jgi:hypothetical protein
MGASIFPGCFRRIVCAARQGLHDGLKLVGWRISGKRRIAFLIDRN